MSTGRNDPVGGDGRSDEHDRVLDRLSEHLDGLLVGEEARRVERHLELCGECRDVLADLERIRGAARGLVDTPPARDLWPAIRRAITAAPVIPLREDAAAVPPARRRGVFLSLPQLAAAALLLLTVGGAGVWLAGPAVVGRDAEPAGAMAPTDGTAGDARFAADGPGAEIGVGYAAEVERLESLLDASRERLTPETVRVLEKNLAIIDRAILESVEALESDPANPWVRDHLRRSWERKVDYLREAAALADWSSTD